MDLKDAARAWQTDGFVILPAFLQGDELSAAVDELPLLFPTAAGFHDRTDPRAERFVGDEFAGIDAFPFASTAISLLAVHHRVLDLAEALLGGGDFHVYTAEAWAKYTGACDYDQDLHRDYLNHTLLVPSTAAEFRQLEMFVFLSDVPEELGPPHLVSRRHTAALPSVPNWFLRPGRAGSGRFLDAGGGPDLYEAEVSGAGPAGTVIAFEAGTFHRGTGLTAPRGVRYSMHLGFRPSGVGWGQRMGWAMRGYERAWVDFVHRADPRQLQAFGFPPPGHPYWTPETLAGTALRYPELDLAPWRGGFSGGRACGRAPRRST
ncbi:MULTISPECIES: phytanoyl-CoA dioxygenase family protein [unclassified Actinomadura]|uniref:phytanoyl-CoA dioxygenase family protein n=1 Tax=unclassified Actinomadura TaxID=2626254 RepID=UPI0011EF1B04|nr:phytanoyl-CoA dioxygenase family protein [Actinomadura sp. K4S16]